VHEAKSDLRREFKIFLFVFKVSLFNSPGNEICFLEDHGEEKRKRNRTDGGKVAIKTGDKPCCMQGSKKNTT
jgi:hypothetical protein